MQISEDDQNFRMYCNGNVKGFERLYAKYRERLYGYFFNSCRDHEIANEMFQELWLKVISSAARYQSRGKFRQWLFSCAHNIIVDHYRGHEPREDYPEVDSLSSASPMDQLEMKEKIETAIHSLPFEQRQAFHLRQQLGCSIDDIAAVQECSKEAAKSRVRYAFARLRERLGDLI